MSFLDELKEAGEKVEDFVKKDEKLTRDKKLQLVFTHHENLPALSKSRNYLILRQDQKGQIYFDPDLNAFYRITAYDWDGPKYQIVEEGGTPGQTVTTSHGGLGTAILGDLLAGPVGAVIGYAAGHHSDTVSTAPVPPTKVKQEINSPAAMTVTSLDGKISYTFEFNDNSRTDKEIRTFNLSLPGKKPSSAPGKTSEESGTASPFTEIEEYKKLLDEGIISQKEFDEKKKQLLGL